MDIQELSPDIGHIVLILDIFISYSMGKHDLSLPNITFPPLLLNYIFGVTLLLIFSLFSFKKVFLTFALSLSIFDRIWHCYNIKCGIYYLKCLKTYVLFLQKRNFLTFLGIIRSSQFPFMPTAIVRIYKVFKVLMWVVYHTWLTG